MTWLKLAYSAVFSPEKLERNLFLIKFIDWRYRQSCAPLTLTFFWLALPPLPFPCVNKYTVNTYKVCQEEGGGVYGIIGGKVPQTVTVHLPQSPFTGQFF
jgi:hypothetical protein